MNIPRPDRSPIFFQAYIDLVEGDDVLSQLAGQLSDTIDLVKDLSEERASSSYAPGKWTIKDVLGHVADTERVFSYRLLWFARGGENTLGGFDQDEFATHGRHTERPLGEVIDDMQAVRNSTVSLIKGCGAIDWHRPVEVSGNPMTPATIPWLVTGHERHHQGILRELYGLGS
ncbi:MAG: DinB family protein [Planctomycetota bacterium]|nr:DinB family protein [Planctomycetota bacterium]